MRSTTRALVASGFVLAAGAAAFGLGFGGSFDDTAALIAGEVVDGKRSAVKMQNFIEKPSDRLSRDFITFSKVAKEAERGGFVIVSEVNLTTEFTDMVTRSGEFGAAALVRMGEALAAEPDPRVAARMYRKQLLTIAKQGKFVAKYQGALDTGNLSKASVFYAAVQKLYEAIDRAFPAG